MTIDLSGAWYGDRWPSRSEVVLHVICAEGGGSLGVVRVMKGTCEPILRTRPPIDPSADDRPTWSRPVHQLDQDGPLSLWCPRCGMTPIDVRALTRAVDGAIRSGITGKLVV